MRSLLVMFAFGVAGAAVGWHLYFTPQPNLSPDRSPLEPPEVTKGKGGKCVNPAGGFHRLVPQRLNHDLPQVAADTQGRVLLAWATQDGEFERTLWLARSSDSGRTFGEPEAFRKVAVVAHTAKMRGKDITRYSGVLPRLATRGNTITLAWTEADREAGRVRMLSTRTSDGGRTFADIEVLTSQQAVRPTYTGLAVTPDQRPIASWLDQRHGKQQPFLSLASPGQDALVYAGPDEKGICPCCDTEVHVAADARVFVAFRNIKGGNRDIYVCKQTGQMSFSEPVCATDSPWRWESCPHDGPSMASAREKLHVVWMDAATGSRRLMLASTPLDAWEFTSRELADTLAGQKGHPRLLADHTGTLHLVFECSQGTLPPGHSHAPQASPAGPGASIFYTFSTDGGASFAKPRAVEPRPGAVQAHPALAVDAAGEPIIAWTEATAEGTQVRCTRLATAESCCEAP